MFPLRGPADACRSVAREVYRISKDEHADDGGNHPSQRDVAPDYALKTAPAVTVVDRTMFSH